MPEFRVTWTIQLNANSPEDAARIALDFQRDPTSEATIFDVELIEENGLPSGLVQEIEAQPLED